MITLKQVTKRYQTGRVFIEALKGIDLEINRGEFIVLSGVSGSGKSTLLNLLGAMDKPTTGSLSMDGQELSSLSSRQLSQFRAKKIGFVFQSFNLIPVLNVYENIVVPLKLKGQAFTKSRVLELIDLVGLSNHLKHRPDELSGGQRQRVAIARAIVNLPPYVLADEPTANLDSATTQSIVGLLTDLNKNLGITLIVASHDPILQEQFGRRLRLKDGHIE